MSTPVDATQTDIEPEQLANWLASEDTTAGEDAAADEGAAAGEASAAAGTGAVQLVDVREQYEREAGRIAGSRHIPMASLSEQASSLDRERSVVFYCRVGSRSTMAAQAFRAAGYTAFSMSGGLVRWAGEGRPLDPPDGYVADH